MTDSYYTDDPVPTWCYHTTPDDDAHRGYLSDCLACKKSKRARANRKKAMATRRKRNKSKPTKTIMVKCEVCSKKIQANSTGLCAECFVPARYVARYNFGKRANDNPGVCKGKGCDTELNSGNKSGYCSKCYNGVARFLNYFKKGASLKPFGITNS